MIGHLENFFPSQFGGEYIFDDIKVNPFTFAPQTTVCNLRRYELSLTTFPSTTCRTLVLPSPTQTLTNMPLFFRTRFAPAPILQ